MREYEKQNQLDRLTVAHADYIKGLRALKFWVHSQAVGTPYLRWGAQMGTRGPSAHNVATS
jgi:hypothetical protein